MSKIAVVGISCLFPGASSSEAFWDALRSGKDCRVDARDEDFGMDVDSVYSEVPDANKIYCLKGGFVRDFEFNSSGFALESSFLESLDKVFQWPLHVAREALTDAGLWRGGEGLASAGLIMGNYAFPTHLSNQLALPVWYREIRKHLGQHLNTELPPLGEENVLPDGFNRFVCGLPASIVARGCGMTGPAYTIDAACSSALYAIKMSSYYLRAGKADIMLAGGVCAPDPWLIHTSFSDLRAYPQNGYSQPFSNDSTGIQTGQGAGVVVLKRLEDAVANGDRIYGTIEGLGLSNDGTGKHLLSPNPAGQELAYRRAYHEAQISPGDIDYIECHATGTPLGDQTELNSLESFFGEKMRHIKLGSVKGMTGHLLTVAGLTSLIKLILSLRHQTLVPTPGVNVKESRRSQQGIIDGHNLLTSTQPWPAGDEPRYAAVSAFGFGGTNAHLVLSDRKNSDAPCQPTDTPNIAVVGMGAHFGPFDSLEKLEHALFAGDRGLRPPSGEVRGLVEDTEAPCGYVESVSIEPLAFRIPPAELKHFNQQQLLMLKVADDALLNAGLERNSREPRNIAVILVMELDLISHLRRAKGELPHYLEKLLHSAGVDKNALDFDELVRVCGNALHSDIESNEVLSYIGNIMASRISSLWNLTGPSFTLSGDGNGVNRALETAQLMLAEGDAEGVLVGAVDLCCIAEEKSLGARIRDQGGALLNNDFGFPIGEGAGAVVLMRDSHAQEQRRRRYATLNLFEPGCNADIGLVQLSGLTDRKAAMEALTPIARQAPTAAVSTLADQLGYSRIAAPIAGLITAALALHHRYLPAQGKTVPGFLEVLESALSNSDNFRPPVSYPWFKRMQQTRAALVLTRSFTGEGNQLLLKEADWPGDWSIVRRELNLIPLVAADRKQLIQRVDQCLSALPNDFEHLRETGWRELVDVNKPGAVAVLAAKGGESLLRECQRLKKHLASGADKDWKTPAGSYLAAEPLPGKVAFVYPGGFNSYPYLSHGFFRLFPGVLREFEETVDDAGRAMSADWIYPRSLATPSSRELMSREQAMLQDIPAMLTNGTSLALLYTRVLRDRFRLHPEVAFGYSLGESSMLFANGVWPAQGRSYDQLAHSPLFQDRLSGRRDLIREKWQIESNRDDNDVWASSVLIASVDKVRELLSQFDRLYITHINTEGELLVAGDPLQLQALIATLGCEAVPTPTSHVLHAEVMRGTQGELAALNRYPSQPPIDGIRLISAGHYQVLETFEQDHIAALNSDSLCREVDFPRLMENAYNEGARTFIEVGPGGTCTRWIGTHFAGRKVSALSVSQRGKHDLGCLEQLLSRLISLQVPMDLTGLVGCHAGTVPGRRVEIGFGATNKQPDFGTLQSPATREVLPPTVAANEEATEAKSTATRVDRETAGAVAMHDLIYWQLDARRLVLGDTHLLVANQTQRQISHPSERSPSNLAPARKPDMKPPNHSALGKNPVAALIRSNIRELISAQKVFLDSQHRIQQMAFDQLHAQLHDDLPTPKPAATPLDYKRIMAPEPKPDPGPVMKEAQLLAFASGRIADAFGSEYAEIDHYPVRVRLPSPPYFFVSRVTQLQARRGHYEPCMLTTEYDVPEDAWYLVDGVMPPGVAVEAGQSDLLLISYLGIDFENKGERMYRLLDGKLAFIGDLPRAGQTLRFDIHINSYVRQGGVLLFFFSYEGYVDGELALKLERGCAGFFSHEQLEQGQGLVSHPQKQRAFLVKPVFHSDKKALDQRDLLALSRGELDTVFGPGANPAAASGVRLPPEQLLMIDLISTLNRPLDSGYLAIEAYKKLDPEGWYFASHFVDDPVLPGSLVAEGATQLLKVHLMSIGMQQCFPSAEFQPIPDLLMDIKVRGQITPLVQELRYEVEIFENGFLPRPYVKANVVVFDGDRPLVAVENLGLCLKEKPGSRVYPRYGEADYFSGRRLPDGTPVTLNEFHLAHAAKGDLKTAMGREFGIYGPNHRAPYIPNGDFQFVDRAVSLTGDRGKYQARSVMVSEYDVPADDWYFRQNSCPAMPNCIYLESALQASILLGYFLGVTLDFPDQELSIRNLDGKATYLSDMDLRGKTLRHKETLLSTSALNGSILQSFRFELTADEKPVYEGESLFGYFPEQALQNQLGLDNGSDRDFWFESRSIELMEFELESETDNPLFTVDPERPHYRLPSGPLNLLHRANLSRDGGEYGKGYVHGYREIRDSDWYFKCHFHRDPVMPGSLGLEAFVQAIQLFALDAQLGMNKFKSPRFGIATEVETEWRYRGQLLMSDRDMNVEVHIKEVLEEADRIVVIADADLFKNKLRIYHVDRMAVAITEGNSDDV